MCDKELPDLLRGGALARRVAKLNDENFTLTVFMCLVAGILVAVIACVAVHKVCDTVVEVYRPAAAKKAP